MLQAKKNWCDVWTFSRVVKVKIHEGTNDDDITEMKHNLQELSGYLPDFDFNN